MGVKQKAYSQQSPMLNILDDSKFKIYPLSFDLCISKNSEFVNAFVNQSTVSTAKRLASLF